MTFEYKVAYSARKSVCVNISSDNEITVRCPYGYKQRKIEELLERKSSWITRHLSANSAKRAGNDDLISYKSILVKGEKLPLIIGKSNEISSTSVSVKSLKSVKNLYCDTLFEEFTARVAEICAVTGLEATSVMFKSYTARWGCCDSRNNIIFNYKLLMLDKTLWDYVILHELCHTVFHNHSKQFWQLVAKFIPDYGARRKRLKSFDFITSLY